MLLGEIQLTGNPFRIECTTHALKRMSERRVGSVVVKNLIANIGDRLLSYNNTGEELAIIDPGNDLAVIVEIRFFKAVVITVIDRGKIFIKEGTRLEQIAC